MATTYFDRDNVLKVLNELRKRFAKTKWPMQRREELLQESLKFLEFVFEVSAELAWINEHASAVSKAVGLILTDAQN